MIQNGENQPARSWPKTVICGVLRFLSLQEQVLSQAVCRLWYELLVPRVTQESQLMPGFAFLYKRLSER